jgi:hypothetical protein
MACGCSQNPGYLMNGGGAVSGGARGVRLEKEKKDALYEKAKKYNIRGRSKMTKAELVDAIRQKQREIGDAISKRRK